MSIQQIKTIIEGSVQVKQALLNNHDLVTEIEKIVHAITDAFKKGNAVYFAGNGGVTIREIVELSGAKVDISDDGIVTIAAPDEVSRNKALEMVKSIIAKAEDRKITL